MAVPDWDLEQLEVIFESPSAWQLVEAGPGAGKSAVACQRVSFLIDEGAAASRILLISFTRTAVAELRDRIASWSIDPHAAGSVRISTIDSQAWAFRHGSGDQPFEDLKSRAAGSYEYSIRRAIDLLDDSDSSLRAFLGRLDHLVIDEAQDIVDVRAELILAVLKSLSDSCGVTILADPAQAIYGFTSEADDGDIEPCSLLTSLDQDGLRPFTKRQLNGLHRVKRSELRRVFSEGRAKAYVDKPETKHVSGVQQVIREAAPRDLGWTSFEELADLLLEEPEPSTLVLFRRRADALMASSFLSQRGVEHRLRMSGTPTVAHPWLGWVLHDYDSELLPEAEFHARWLARKSEGPAPLEGHDPEACWNVLHRLAASRRRGAVSIQLLRELLGRSRPPVDLCTTEAGYRGPTLGTIHGSKGREANRVIVYMPTQAFEPPVAGKALEEGRVYYVGATRARQLLFAASHSSISGVKSLPSGRVCRKLKGHRFQLEIGRADDVDLTAHLSWESWSEVQTALAHSVGATQTVSIRAIPEQEFVRRIELTRREDGIGRVVEVGEMGKPFDRDLWAIAKEEPGYHPALRIGPAYLVGVTTVALPNHRLHSARGPHKVSGIGLAPVIKGFCTIPLHRSKR